MNPIVSEKIEVLGHYALDKVLPTLLFIVIGILVIRIIKKFIRRILERSKLEKAAHSLICSLIGAMLYLLLGLIAASGLGIDVTGIIALASVLTLAVSLSVQDALTNIIGGFTLLCTHPFKSGDFVEIAGKSGTVKEIGIAYTKLITADNKTISIPNSAVTAADIVNFTAIGTRRAEINVSASYEASVPTVLEALLKATDIEPALKEPAPAAIVENYGDSAINYTVYVWANSADFWTVKNAVTQKIPEEFEKAGIEMTYPHLNVHLDK